MSQHSSEPWWDDLKNAQAVSVFDSLVAFRNAMLLQWLGETGRGLPSMEVIREHGQWGKPTVIKGQRATVEIFYWDARPEIAIFASGSDTIISMKGILLNGTIPRMAGEAAEAAEVVMRMNLN